MMSRPLLRATFAAIAVGALGGGAAAVLLPDAAKPTVATAAAGPPPAVAPPPARVVRTARPPRDLRFAVRLRPLAPPDIAVRRPDPRGGPAWAVRAALVERRAPPDPGSTATHAIGRSRCAQVGRLHKGTFGWLDLAGTFRPVPLRFAGAPSVCGSRRPDMNGKPQLAVFSTTTDLRRPVAAPMQTIVYGLVGTAARGVELRVAGRPVPLVPGPGGAVMAVLPGSVRKADVRVSVAYPGRGRVRALGGPPDAPPRLPSFRPFPVPTGEPVLTAQAPDPDGGLPYGLVVSASSEGGRCSGTGGRVVGDRVGDLDMTLGTLTEGGGGGSCSGRPRPGEKPPAVAWSTTFAGGIGTREGEVPAAGRIARRTTRGRLVVAGLARPEVVSVRLQSPSDLRTLVPTGPGHGIIVVYEDFATGSLKTIATFADGHEERQTMPLGGF